MRETILVTDVDRGSGLTIVRSLGRKGWRVIAASAKENAIGFHSRYRADTLVYPAPEKDSEAFVNVILQAVKQHQIALIIPVTDEAILPLSRAREQFEGLCKIAFPSRDQLEVVTNKLKTLELAKAHQVPIPFTYLLRSVQEVDALLADLRWPVVLKPMQSRRPVSGSTIDAFKVSYAANAEDLRRQAAAYEGRCEILLQVYHPGEGHGVELLMWEGKPVCAFQHKRLHEVPITGGASALRESVPLDPLLYQYSVALLGALKWSGLAMVEFKLSEDGPRLMEINGRVWGSLPLAVHSGMDFPAHLADLHLGGATGEPKTVNTAYRIGVQSRNLSLDVTWLLSVLRGKKQHEFMRIPSRSELLPSILGYMNPFIMSDVQSWSDPLPGLVEFPQIIAKLLKKVH